MLNRRVLGKSAWFAGSSPAMTQKMSPSRRLDLDIGPWSSYIASTRSFKDAFREGIRECGAGAVAAGGRIRPVPRPARASCLPILRSAREVLTGLGQAKAGNARQTASQEAW